eukprot:m.479666 g.479666  ORF g.479666 m.479666 type:complete len:245 (+) comp21704_c0_seq2:383-1117(+)
MMTAAGPTALSKPDPKSGNQARFDSDRTSPELAWLDLEMRSPESIARSPSAALSLAKHKRFRQAHSSRYDDAKKRRSLDICERAREARGRLFDERRGLDPNPRQPLPCVSQHSFGCYRLRPITPTKHLRASLTMGSTFTPVGGARMPVRRGPMHVPEPVVDMRDAPTPMLMDLSSLSLLDSVPVSMAVDSGDTPKKLRRSGSCPDLVETQQVVPAPHRRVQRATSSSRISPTLPVFTSSIHHFR